MANERGNEWLRPVVRKAVAESLGEEPKDVFIHKSNITVVMGVPFKATYKVWARVTMAEHSYEVFLDAAIDGSYSGFRIVE